MVKKVFKYLFLYLHYHNCPEVEETKPRLFPLSAIKPKTDKN